jgi:hypothetical protein
MCWRDCYKYWNLKILEKTFKKYLIRPFKHRTFKVNHVLKLSHSSSKIQIKPLMRMILRTQFIHIRHHSTLSRPILNNLGAKRWSKSVSQFSTLGHMTWTQLTLSTSSVKIRLTQYALSLNPTRLKYSGLVTSKPNYHALLMNL